MHATADSWLLCFVLLLFTASHAAIESQPQCRIQIGQHHCQNPGQPFSFSLGALSSNLNTWISLLHYYISSNSLTWLVDESVYWETLITGIIRPILKLWFSQLWPIIAAEDQGRRDDLSYNVIDLLFKWWTCFVHNHVCSCPAVLCSVIVRYCQLHQIFQNWDITWVKGILYDTAALSKAPQSYIPYKHCIGSIKGDLYLEIVAFAVVVILNCKDVNPIARPSTFAAAGIAADPAGSSFSHIWH